MATCILRMCMSCIPQCITDKGPDISKDGQLRIPLRDAPCGCVQACRTCISHNWELNHLEKTKTQLCTTSNCWANDGLWGTSFIPLYYVVVVGVVVCILISCTLTLYCCQFCLSSCKKQQQQLINWQALSLVIQGRRMAGSAASLAHSLTVWKLMLTGWKRAWYDHYPSNWCSTNWTTEAVAPAEAAVPATRYLLPSQESIRLLCTVAKEETAFAVYVLETVKWFYPSLVLLQHWLYCQEHINKRLFQHNKVWVARLLHTSRNPSTLHGHSTQQQRWPTYVYGTLHWCGPTLTHICVRYTALMWSNADPHTCTVHCTDVVQRWPTYVFSYRMQSLSP